MLVIIIYILSGGCERTPHSLTLLTAEDMIMDITMNLQPFIFWKHVIIQQVMITAVSHA